MRTVRKSGFRASYIQPTWKAWMGPPLQQSVTQPVIARYVRLSASPCRLSRAHASGERVHAAGGQRVHAGCRSCVGKRCIVSALTRCVANINQDNRRILRLSSVGSLPLAKNALHLPTSSKYRYIQTMGGADLGEQPYQTAIHCQRSQLRHRFIVAPPLSCAYLIFFLNTSFAQNVT